MSPPHLLLQFVLLGLAAWLLYLSYSGDKCMTPAKAGLWLIWTAAAYLMEQRYGPIPSNTPHTTRYTHTWVLGPTVFMIWGLQQLVWKLGAKISTGKCAVCGEKTSDHFFSGKKSEKLCRRHLLERFREAFLKTSSRLIVFHPGLDHVTATSYTYGYYELKKLREGFSVNASIQKKLESYLSAIPESCEECGAKAQVAYFEKGSFGWVLWNKKDPQVPDMEKLSSIPKALCLNCCHGRVAPSLQNYTGSFGDSFAIPSEKQLSIPGVYITCLV